MDVGGARQRFRPWRAAVVLLAASIVLMWFISDANAQELSGIVASTDAPMDLVVNGRSFPVPVEVEPGSQVCVQGRVAYESEVDRWVFQRWEHGPEETCVNLNATGSYRALFERQVLIQVRSLVPSERQSLWLPLGAEVEFSVPPIVPVSDRVRYRFLEWSAGETPFNAQTIFVPLRAGAIEPRRVKEYFVAVESSEAENVGGTGWYADGAEVFVQAPEQVAFGKTDERRTFSNWTSDAFPPIVFSDPTSSLTSFTVSNTFVVRPRYERQFLVRANGPAGVLKSEWATEGGRLQVDTPPIIEVVPDQERWRFTSWQGLPGLNVPSIEGVIVSPVTLEASYVREFKVTVIAPFGGGQSGWYPIGSTVSISVPSSTQSRLVFMNQFEEFSGLGVRKPSTQIVVQAPVTITAIYQSRINLGVLFVFALLPLAIMGMFLSYRSIVLMVNRRTFRY